MKQVINELIILLVKHRSVSLDKQSPQAPARFHQTFSDFPPTGGEFTEIEPWKMSVHQNK